MQKGNQKKNGFTVLELLIIIAIIALLVSIILVNVALQRERAEFTAFQQYVSDVSRLARSTATVGAFDTFKRSPLNTAAHAGCLGDYSLNSDACWGASPVFSRADADINQALQALGALPEGQPSPASAANNFGTAIRVDGRSGVQTVQVWAWTGANRLDLCNKFGWEGTIVVNANSCYVEFDF